MAAPKKKSPKKASQLFEGIIKASVSGNPKPKVKNTYKKDINDSIKKT